MMCARFHARRRIAIGALCLGAVLLTAACEQPSDVRRPATASELPQTLRETELYASWSTKTVAHDNRPFTPQYPLWSDGATKRRWVHLPRGTWIDATSIDDWQFPVGTRFWKEFSFGRRVETRYMERTPAGWRYATYVWSDDETEATLAPARGALASATVAEGLHHVLPAVTDCRACHENGPTPVLGFSALQLSWDRDPLAPNREAREAGALDLRELLATGRVRGAAELSRSAPPRIAARTPTERAALGYLHGNCGGCHRRSSSLSSVGLVLAYSLERDVGRRAILASIVDRPSHFRLEGIVPGVRIAAGRPERSVLLARIRSRAPNVQMPPLGTQVVDERAAGVVERWIGELDPTRNNQGEDR